jgi:hypothetical protein
LIEVSVADAPHASASAGPAALIDACSAGSGGRDCVLVDAVDRANSDVVAKVSWTGPERRLANIRVGLGLADHRSWQTRDIEFKTTDDPTERWRSVGLVIAGVAADPTQAIATVEPQRPSEAHPIQEERGTNAPPVRLPRRSEVWLEAGLLAGPLLDDGSWEAGGWVRGSWTTRALPLGVTTSLGYERRLGNRGDFELHAPSASVGLLAFTDVFRLNVAARVEVIQRLLVLSASDAETGHSDTHHRWQTGFRAGGVVGAPIGREVSVLGGADVTWAAAADIQVRNALIGRLPSVSASGFLGVRWTLEAW